MSRLPGGEDMASDGKLIKDSSGRLIEWRLVA